MTLLRPGDDLLIQLANEHGCSVVNYHDTPGYSMGRRLFQRIDADGYIHFGHGLNIDPLHLNDALLIFRPVPSLDGKLWIPPSIKDTIEKATVLHGMMKDMSGRVVGLTHSAYVWTMPFAFTWEADAIYHVLDK